MIDRTRVVGDLLFATHGDRCFHLGKSARDQLRWLEEYPGRWRRIEDVRQEDAPSRAPVEAEDLGAGPAEPNGQTSSHDVRKDGGEQSDVTLVDVPAGDSSPPHQPPMPSLPVEENFTAVPTKAELPHGVTAAMSETKEPKAETNPLEAVGRKRGRRRDRQPEKQKLPPGIPKSTPKLSPKLMRIILNALREYPVLSDAANKAGIHRKTLEYWLKRSAAGDAGYDIEWEGFEWRFHEHRESAISEARQKLDDDMLQRALFGYDKVLTYRGRVTYQIDQDLVSQGYQGPDAYLRDENGNPVPETIRKVDAKELLSALKRLRANRLGKRPKIDVPREGGVLVLGDVTKKPQYNTARSVEARKWKTDSRRIREEKD